MKNRIIVEICDKEYTLLADEPEDYVKSLAVEVNKMIEDTAYKNLRTSKADAVILTCLDLCHKNRQLMEDNDNMRKNIAMYVDEIAILNKKIASYERQKTPKNGNTKFSTADEEPADNLI